MARGGRCPGTEAEKEERAKKSGVRGGVQRERGRERAGRWDRVREGEGVKKREVERWGHLFVFDFLKPLYGRQGWEASFPPLKIEDTM